MSTLAIDVEPLAVGVECRDYMLKVTVADGAHANLESPTSQRRAFGFNGTRVLTCSLEGEHTALTSVGYLRLIE